MLRCAVSQSNRRWFRCFPLTNTNRLSSSSLGSKSINSSENNDLKEEREEWAIGQEAMWVQEIVALQKRSVEATVPWFLQTMPSSYFRQTDSALQKQHLLTIASLRELGQTDLNLKMETKLDDHGSMDLTYINTGAQLGLLHSQITHIKVPPKAVLARVKVFSALDNSLALNIFSFESLESRLQCANESDAERLMQYVSQLKAGAYLQDKRVPLYDATRHSPEAMKAYVARCSPSYVRLSDPRRFLMQQDLFFKVWDSESAAVHLEPAVTPGSHDAWITIAASNVLPEVLLRLSTNIIMGHGVNVQVRLIVISLLCYHFSLYVALCFPEGAFRYGGQPRAQSHRLPHLRDDAPPAGQPRPDCLRH